MSSWSLRGFSFFNILFLEETTWWVSSYALPSWIYGLTFATNTKSRSTNSSTTIGTLFIINSANKWPSGAWPFRATWIWTLDTLRIWWRKNSNIKIKSDVEPNVRLLQYFKQFSGYYYICVQIKVRLNNHSKFVLVCNLWIKRIFFENLNSIKSNIFSNKEILYLPLWSGIQWIEWILQKGNVICNEKIGAQYLLTCKIWFQGKTIAIEGFFTVSIW